MKIILSFLILLFPLYCFSQDDKVYNYREGKIKITESGNVFEITTAKHNRELVKVKDDYTYVDLDTLVESVYVINFIDNIVEYKSFDTFNKERKDELKKHYLFEIVDKNYLMDILEKGIKRNDNVLSLEIFTLFERFGIGKFREEMYFTYMHGPNGAFVKNKLWKEYEKSILIHNLVFESDGSYKYTGYYNNGNKKVEGLTDSSYKKQGIWLYYDKNGRVEEKEFRNGDEISK